MLSLKRNQVCWKFLMITKVEIDCFVSMHRLICVFHWCEGITRILLSSNLFVVACCKLISNEKLDSPTCQASWSTDLSCDRWVVVRTLKSNLNTCSSGAYILRVAFILKRRDFKIASNLLQVCTRFADWQLIIRRGKYKLIWDLIKTGGERKMTHDLRPITNLYTS